MGFLAELALLKKAKEFNWGELPENGYVKGRLATSEDYFAGSASFFSMPSEDANIPAEHIEIPQYAYHNKSRWLKIPCIVIQAEGKGNAYLIGYKNLLNGENGVAWIDEIEFLGKTPPQK